MGKLIAWFIVVLLVVTGCSGSGGSTASTNSPQLLSISLSPLATSYIANGSSQQYSATATYSDGTTTTVTPDATWSSSNIDVATVDATGLATVNANSGSTNITATYNSISTSVILNATSAAVISTTIAPLTSIIADGYTQQYLAIVTYSDGFTSPITTNINWISSNPTIATIDKNGLATIKSNSGTTDITAVYNGISSESTTLKATSALVTAISIAPLTSTIVNGKTQQYIATATYSDGTTSMLTSGLVWSSTNTNVATVTSNGLATILANSGTTSIKATYGSISSKLATLKASSAVVTSISVAPSKSQIANGLTQQYKATATYSDGTTSILTTGVTWNSSNTGVATIDSSGMATVRADSGSTSITANYANITSHSAKLNATSAIITLVTISPGTSTIFNGSTQQYSATATYSDGTTSPLTSGVVWNSTDTSVATIDTSGLATVHVNVGITYITATYSNITSGQAILNASSTEILFINLTPGISNILNESTQQYTATAYYKSGITSPLTTGVTWTSSNTSIATIDSTGLATVHASSGTANITATYNSITSNLAFISATSSVVEFIIISPLTASINTGRSQQYTATATYYDGTVTPITTGATWVSSSPNIATIDDTGLASAGNSNTGSTAIYVTLDGVNSPDATLTVIPTLLYAITVTPSTSTILNGSSQQYTVTGYYSNGTHAPITTGITWTSSNTSVATINATGLATALSNSGTTSITASVAGPYIPLTGSATLNTTSVVP